MGPILISQNSGQQLGYGHFILRQRKYHCAFGQCLDRREIEQITIVTGLGVVNLCEFRLWIKRAPNLNTHSHKQDFDPPVMGMSQRLGQIRGCLFAAFELSKTRDCLIPALFEERFNQSPCLGMQFFGLYLVCIARNP